VMLGNLVVQLKRIDMKAKPKTPAKTPKKGIPVSIMVAIGKPKMPMPMKGSRTATNMMKKSSRGK
jgi:hypothetical protein